MYLIVSIQDFIKSAVATVLLHAHGVLNQLAHNLQSKPMAIPVIPVSRHCFVIMLALLELWVYWGGGVCHVRPVW